MAWSTCGTERTLHIWTLGHSAVTILRWVFKLLKRFSESKSHFRHTGWCILSRTSAISHTVHRGDAPVYYLRVILLIWNILTRITEVMSVNKLRKMCDVMRMVSRIVKNNHYVVHQYSVKKSRKCIKTILKVSRINMFNQKLQNCKTIFAFLGIFSI